MNGERPVPGMAVTDQSNAQRAAGSVRAARERAQVGLPSGSEPDRDTVDSGMDTTAARQCVQTTTSITTGAAISAPRPIPQWPLRSEDNGIQQIDNHSPNIFSQAKGKPPQRPPRPTYVPSILDTSRLREHTPVYQYRQPLSPPTPEKQQDRSYWDRNFPLSSPSTDSAPFGTPKTAYSGTSFSSSRPSTSSSVGSIPDFPIPAIPPILPLQPTRRALGPPPSSRRGASSYYSQNSFVAPIPEEVAESVKNSHGSFASSHVMPTSWGDGPPDSYVVDEDECEDDDIGDGVDGRSSGSGDHDESTSLVRKISLAKRQEPSLTNLKGRDGVNRECSNTGPSSTDIPPPVGISKPNLISRAAVGAGLLEEARPSGSRVAENEPANSGHDNLTSRNALLNPSTASDGSLKSTSAAGSRNHSPGGSSIDPRVRQILGGLEKGLAINPGTLSPITSLSSESINKMKRPQRQDFDAVKDPEVRGSLTSLPELIRRATKLASNLDRGKTASRLGLFDVLNANDQRTEKVDGRVRSGSLTNILASFPPPALNSTPTSSRGRTTSRWPSPFANADGLGQHSSLSDYKPNNVPQKLGRRCCGMPLWGFAILMMILMLLIAAAVIIPVTLIVIPRQNAQAADNAAATSLSNCRNTTPCANGGTSLVSGDACGCVCANGFTGPNCSQTADTGCTTINVNSTSQSSSTYKNATIGSSIPRLLSASLANFSIPLNYTAILAVFSATNLSCSSENALVQFNGASQRRDVHPVEQLKPFEAIEMRAAVLSPRAPAPQATPGPVTSNGIIFAGSTTAPTATSTPTAYVVTSGSTAASPTVSSLPSGEVAITSQDLDFARISVLFILQESSLGAAIAAQQSLQGVLLGNTFQSGNEKVLVGSNVTVNLMTETILLANGTIVGGKVR